jgi:hypothetical protein
MRRSNDMVCTNNDHTAPWNFMKKSNAPPNPTELPAEQDGLTPFVKLDLPNAPDFVSRRSSLSFDQMLALLEEYRSWFPMTEAQRAQRLERKCNVEFVL